MGDDEFRKQVSGSFPFSTAQKLPPRDSTTMIALRIHFILFPIIFRERAFVLKRRSSVKVPYSAAVMCTRQEALEAMNFN